MFALLPLILGAAILALAAWREAAEERAHADALRAWTEETYGIPFDVPADDPSWIDADPYAYEEV